MRDYGGSLGYARLYALQLACGREYEQKPNQLASNVPWRYVEVYLFIREYTATHLALNVFGLTQYSLF